MTLAIVLLLSLAGISGLVVTARTLRLRRMRRLLGQELAGLPDELRSLWKTSTRARTLGNIPAIIGGGGVTVGHAIFELSKIDPGVLNAIDHAKGGNPFSSYNDLVAQVENAGRDGLISNYKGYYGELTIADLLRTKGHHVELASTPNQEGWDALVDGQPVQFKAGLGPQTITDHLERFPDIPVVTVSEHAERFADNDMVTTLPELSGVELQNTTKATMEGVDRLDDVPLDFPLMTFLVSGAKNAYLVAKGKSNLRTAAKYTAADTIGIGGGAALGGKLGILIGGAVFGPPGAAIGVLLGSLTGAVIGGVASNEYKERKLRAAQSGLNAALELYPKAALGALNSKAKSLDDVAARITPAGFSWVFWPSLGQVASLETANSYRAWSSNCRKQARHLSAAVRKIEQLEKSEEHSLANVASEYLSSDSAEPVFSREVQAIVSQVSRHVMEVHVENGKLGRSKD